MRGSLVWILAITWHSHRVMLQVWMQTLQQQIWNITDWQQDRFSGMTGCSLAARMARQ